jgi:diadenosine tetraphosphate (Ap4A) HIT family hydrolase
MEPMKCVFCHPEDSDMILRGEKSYVRYDKYPVSPGHLLIIPFRHVSSVFELREDEVADMLVLINKAKEYIKSEFHPDGYNIGVNVGDAAGQTVMHVHIHLIPRYLGDMENPQGGVRGVIPKKQKY